MVDDRDPVADPLDFREEVRVQEDARPGLPCPADDRADVGPADRIQRRRRLVEDHERRAAEQRDRQPEPLLHALREATDGVIGPIEQADLVQDDDPAPPPTGPHRHR